MGFQGIFPMNKHEMQSNFVRFGIHFNRKLCLKFSIKVCIFCKVYLCLLDK